MYCNIWVSSASGWIEASVWRHRQLDLQRAEVDSSLYGALALLYNVYITERGHIPKWKMHIAAGQSFKNESDAEMPLFEPNWPAALEQNGSLGSAISCPIIDDGSRGLETASGPVGNCQASSREVGCRNRGRRLNCETMQREDHASGTWFPYDDCVPRLAFLIFRKALRRDIPP